MKKLILILLSVVLFSSAAYSQSLGVFAGYGSSAFDDEDLEEQSNYIPVGVHILFGSGGSFEFGAEVDYAVTPFTFEEEGFGDLIINQLYYGALAKVKFGSGDGMKPYARAGAGMYTGNFEFDYSDELKNLGAEDIEFEMKDSFGFNVGGGIDINMNATTGIFVEFVYHIVEREVEPGDGIETEPFGANNWALHAGISFGL